MTVNFKQSRPASATVAMLLAGQHVLSTAHAADLNLEQAELIPANIHHVSAGISGLRGDNEQFNHKLVIQWLRRGPETQRYDLTHAHRLN